MSHTTAFEAEEKEQGGQSSHLDEAAVAAKEPGRHGNAAVAPIGHEDPAGQTPQPSTDRSCVSFEDVPPGHEVGVTEPSTQ